MRRRRHIRQFSFMSDGVYRPRERKIEHENGTTTSVFRTRDGALYQRDQRGTIRRVNPEAAK